MRGAGAVLGPGSLAGRTMSAIGTGLDQTVRGQDRERRGPRAPRVPSLASTSRLTPPEVAGYTEALRDMQRDLKGPAEAAGLDLSAVERDALAPVWAAAQHQPLTSMARQAGFGDRASREEMVSDFVAHRLEEQLVARGFLGESVTRPGKPPATPLSDHPTLLDYDRGQRMRWATGGGDMATYAGLHHAIRRHAVVPQVGLAAARDFYEAAVASGSVSGAIEAARRHGASAGVPDARLDPWVRQLQRRT